LTEYFPEKLTALYNWIIENKDSKKISFVMGLGDINSNDTDSEWAISSELLKSLAAAGIPQSIVCGGNHDSMPQFAKWLNTEYFSNAYSEIMEMGFWDDPTNGPTFANAYSIMTIGETKYMFVTLEYGPKSAQVEWANEVIAAHPDCNVILSTHTGNISKSSFAAEVEFHAKYLTSLAKIKLPLLKKSIYDSAVRADMTIGDADRCMFAPYYRENSKIVKKQYKLHKEVMKEVNI
jgi:hypothetical protein